MQDLDGSSRDEERGRERENHSQRKTIIE